MISLCFLRAAFISLASTSLRKTQEPRGLGTAARSLPSRVWKKPLVGWNSVGYRKTTTYLQDSLGSLVEDVLSEVVIIHGETDTREEVEKSLVLLVAEDSSHVRKSGRVSHVDGDGVTVTKRRVRDQLVERRPA
jgi:hypothetical protein